MPIQILHKETEAIIDNITTQVKRLKNGVVADALKKAGITYDLSYGVSIVHLRNIAKNYKKDNVLALALWRKKWRETMILATMLLESNEGGVKLLEQFTLEAHTEELFQQLGLNGISNLPNAENIIVEYLKTGNVQKRIVACYAISKVCTASGSQKSAEVFVSLLMDVKSPELCSWMEINAIGKAMAKAGFLSGIAQDVILEHYKKLSQKYVNWNVTYELIKTEFEYR